ncbi:MAG: hypothetical protein ACJAS1_003266 [Oleiphilaceae bacterium]|jgi:hypothetical protein
MLFLGDFIQVTKIVTSKSTLPLQGIDFKGLFLACSLKDALI